MVKGLPLDRCPATNKVMWPTEEGARREAKYIRKHVGAKVRAYLCWQCGAWHIGHWKRYLKRPIIRPV